MVIILGCYLCCAILQGTIYIPELSEVSPQSLHEDAVFRIFFCPVNGVEEDL